MDSLVHTLGNIPTSTWWAVGAAGLISVLVQAIKHWLEGVSPKTLMILLTAFSFGASAINYLTSQATTNPTVLGQETATLVGLATVLYRFLVKPGYTLLTDVSNYKKSLAPEVPTQTGGNTTSTVTVSNATPTPASNEASF